MVKVNKSKTLVTLIFFIVLAALFLKICIYKRKLSSSQTNNESLSFLFDRYILNEDYDSIVFYTIENITKINKVQDVIESKILLSKNNLYSQINKAQLLMNLIIINPSDNIKNYIELQKTIVKISKINYKNIDEYFSVLKFFFQLLKNRDFEIDFLEAVAESGIKIINDFINDYYGIGEKNNINGFVVDMYKIIYRQYLSILVEKYNLDTDKIKNINNLNNEELKYFLAKKDAEKYDNIDYKMTFLLPIGKIIGKTTLYYTISRIFKNKTASNLTTMFGIADVGTDAISLTKKVNYVLYAEDIHRKNRIKAIGGIYSFNISDFVYNLYLFCKGIRVNIHNIFYENTKIIRYRNKNEKVVNDGINNIKNNHLKIIVAKMKVNEVNKNDALFSDYKDKITKEIEVKEREINKQINTVRKNKLLSPIDNFILRKTNKNNTDKQDYNKIINALGDSLDNFKRDKQNELVNFRRELDEKLQNKIQNIDNTIKIMTTTI